MHSVWPGLQVIGSPLFTRMHVLARSLPHPAVLFLSSQAARQTTETRRMRKTDRTRDGQTGRFHLSGRPPNGLPPRSCVIYVSRALAPFFFCPRQWWSFSRDPLSLPPPARHHKVEINKSSPGWARALKKMLFFFWRTWIASMGKKEAASLPRAEALVKRLDSIFRMLCLLITGWYLKITMEHEKMWSVELKKAKQCIFDWQSGGQMVCFEGKLSTITQPTWRIWGRCRGQLSLVMCESLVLRDEPGRGFKKARF